MRFTIRQNIGRLKVSLMVGMVTKVRGINSELTDGNHIIMWEFDEPDERLVRQMLWAAQALHGLPAIHISQSHLGGGYHAYCLVRKTWIETIAIVASTRLVDPRYISMCAMRGHWTLRLTDKGEGRPRFIGTLPSGWPENVEIGELKSWVDYEVWTNKRVLTLRERGRIWHRTRWNPTWKQSVQLVLGDCLSLPLMGISFVRNVVSSRNRNQR